MGREGERGDEKTRCLVGQRVVGESWRLLLKRRAGSPSHTKAGLAATATGGDEATDGEECHGTWCWDGDELVLVAGVCEAYDIV